MGKPENGSRSSALMSLALVGQLGVVVAAPIVGGVLIGKWLDSLAGGGGLILIGMILLGIVVGVYGAYKMLAGVVDWKQ
jgi:F0F1-type ATP synthase assembly protein I